MPRALLLHISLPAPNISLFLPLTPTSPTSWNLMTVPTPGPMPQTNPLGLCYAPILTGSHLPSGAQFRSLTPLSIIDCLLISLQGVRAKQAPLFSLPSYNQAWYMGFRYRGVGSDSAPSWVVLSPVCFSSRGWSILFPAPIPCPQAPAICDMDFSSELRKIGYLALLAGYHIRERQVNNLALPKWLVGDLLSPASQAMQPHSQIP